MPKFATIEEYNKDLIMELKQIDLIDYFKYVHHNYYEDINISFMDYFLEICKDNNKFIINQEKLKEYRVLNNIDTSAVIKRCLNQYNLIENKDYLLYNVVQQLPSGAKYCKEYKLTPKAFKICLIKAKNSDIYANYYLLLEEVFKYYTDYEKEYRDYIISLQSTDIKNLNKKVDNQTHMMEEQTNIMKEQSKRINELLGHTYEIKEQNNELLDNAEILDETVYDLSNKVDDLYITIDEIKEDKNERCENSNNDHFFSLIKIQKNEYKIINGTGSYNDIVIKKIPIEDTIINKEYAPNARTLFIRFKENEDKELKNKLDLIKNNKSLKNKIKLKQTIKDNPNFSIKYSKIILVKGTEEDLINKLLNTNNKRLEIFNKP